MRTPIVAKASISIGIDDATGQPESAPEGPYITDRDEDSRSARKRTIARARSAGKTKAARHPDREDSRKDLASHRKGAAQP